MDEKTPAPRDEAPEASTEERQRRVREKLRQLYGDDSAEAVRRLLADLVAGEKPDDG